MDRPLSRIASLSPASLTAETLSGEVCAKKRCKVFEYIKYRS